MTPLERFEAKFAKTEGCWNWIARKNPLGYGQFRFAKQMQQANRVAWMLYVGDIPDGLHVLHHCDNPACVRPDHLFLGTDADNAHDRENKGRGHDRSGENNGRSKLTKEQAKKIKARQGDGTKQADLAKEFGVSQTTISNIFCQNTWHDGFAAGAGWTEEGEE